jgi:hypothetical protein
MELGLCCNRGLSRANDVRCRCAPRRRKAFRCARGGEVDLVATVTDIALERFDALTRDNRNHENCGYSRLHTSIRCHRIRSARKRACTKLAPKLSGLSFYVNLVPIVVLMTTLAPVVPTIAGVPLAAVVPTIAGVPLAAVVPIAGVPLAAVVPIAGVP